VISQRQQIAVLEKEVNRLRQDCLRQQALVRASQRTIGLAASGPPATKPAAKPAGKATAKAAGTVAGKAKRKRRPVARALKAVAALQTSPVDQRDPQAGAPSLPGESLVEPISAIATDADVLQQSVPSSSLAAARTAAPACGSQLAAVLEA
jgi:hypothetical protein